METKKRQNMFQLMKCLNRTMQYGNDILVLLQGIISPRLNRTMQYGNAMKRASAVPIPTAFKSYYVVWKLLFEKPHLSENFGLNRTMQYGNCT